MIPDQVTAIPQINNTPPRLNPIWEVMPNFRCPVIGSCLSVEEQRKILKKSGYVVKKMRAYQVHHCLMEQMADENPVSIKTDRYIRHKHKSDIEKYQCWDMQELETAWEQTFRHGNIEGLFYVIATHPGVPRTFLDRAFGDVHMLCHTNMKDILNARRALDTELAGKRKLASYLNAEKEKNKIQRALTKKQNQDLTKLEKEVSCLNRQIQHLADVRRDPVGLTQEVDALHKQIDSMKKAFHVLQQENQSLERQKRKLEIRNFELQHTKTLLLGEVQELIQRTSDSGQVSCGEECSMPPCNDCRDCPKRILMVGGITKMKSLYRDIVESKGIEFTYHDGYMKNGSKHLKEMVCRSDLILCPVNCNSHNACLRIKKLGKKYNKTVKMLPGSSLSMVSGALANITHA